MRGDAVSRTWQGNHALRLATTFAAVRETVPDLHSGARALFQIASKWWKHVRVGHQAERGPINLTFEGQTVSALRNEILGKIDDIHECIVDMQRYMAVRLRLNDLHGVMDASADLRELSAKADALHGVAVALGKIRR